MPLPLAAADGPLDLVLAACLGVALAASAGLRAFLPLLLTGLWGRWGGLELGESFAWLSAGPALVVLGVAVLVEVTADKVPALDHALDLAQGPVRTTCGALVCMAVLADFPAWATAGLGLVVGGGTALSVHGAKAALRVGSTAATGGAANPVLSLLEDLAAGVGAALAIALQAVAVLLALAVLLAIALLARRLVRRRRNARGSGLASESPGG